MTSLVIDTHAHLLPEVAWTIPKADGDVRITDHAGDLHLGSASIALDGPSLYDPFRMLEDMDRCGIDVRVVSVPPYAFPLGAEAAAAERYCDLSTQALVDACAVAPDRLWPLGQVPLGSARAATTAIERLAGSGVRGVEIPTIIGGQPMGQGVGREILRAAADAGLPVLVHPVQFQHPELSGHYLNNLIGNPYETAVAVASCALGGVLDELPELRLLFSHGGGCAPILIGRWDHGWRRRGDVGIAGGRPPSEVLKGRVYVDAITFNPSAARLTAEMLGREAMVLGSDYPFDMGDPDPVGSARTADLDLDELTANALRWLGCAESD
jgi:aminocarboxymuconate-semialdehyde decarboxylase